MSLFVFVKEIAQLKRHNFSVIVVSCWNHNDDADRFVNTLLVPELKIN